MAPTGFLMGSHNIQTANTPKVHWMKVYGTITWLWNIFPAFAHFLANFTLIELWPNISIEYILKKFKNTSLSNKLNHIENLYFWPNIRLFIKPIKQV